MKKLVVYLLDAELEILPESELHNEEGGNMAFVYGFVPATNSREAYEKLKKEFVNLKCKIVEIRNVMPYAGLAWENWKQQKEYDTYAAAAAKHRQIVFSPFLTYLPD